MIPGLTGNPESVGAIVDLVKEGTIQWAKDSAEELGTSERVSNMSSLVTQKSIQHAYIVPTPHLNILQWTPSQFHLILAHLMKDKAYADHYKKLKEEGHFIIMDNGAFEEGTPYQTKELLRICKENFAPDVIVAPDYPQLPYYITMKSFEDFQEEWGDHYPEMEIMAVPQSETGDWKGWLAAYDYFRAHKRADWIGLSILGIPNAFCAATGTMDISTNRVYACTAIQRLFNKRDEIVPKKHHALGMGSPRELLLQKAIGLIDSNDSSSAVWHGLHGIKFDDSATALIGGKIKIPVDFNKKFVIDAHIQECLTHNINYMEQMR